ALPTAGPTANVTIWLAPAARVKVELVEGFTPFGKPPMVTFTAPVNPFIGFAVTVTGTLVVVWAVNSELGETESEKLGGALTVMPLELPVTAPFTVSVAVIVWLPPVFNVTANVPVPLVRVVFAGNTACESLLVKCTVPV